MRGYSFRTHPLKLNQTILERYAGFNVCEVVENNLYNLHSLSKAQRRFKINNGTEKHPLRNFFSNFFFHRNFNIEKS